MPTVPDRFGEAGRKRSYFRPAGGTETDGAPFGRRSFPTVSCYEYTIPCPSACDPARWTALTSGPCPRVPGYRCELFDGAARIRLVDGPSMR
jgi:hypothetical protein